MMLKVNSVNVRLVDIYRPLRSTFREFFEELLTLLELLTPNPDKLVILGDFNIHVDVATDHHARQFTYMADSFGLVQHINSATHIEGKILELVLSRSVDKMIADCWVADPVSDHFIVNAIVKAHRPVLPQRNLLVED